MAHKRIDIAVRAFNQLGLPLVIAGDGPDARHLRRIAGPTSASPAASPTPTRRGSCRAAARWSSPAIEEFGIAAVEAQAAGPPGARRPRRRHAGDRRRGRDRALLGGRRRRPGRGGARASTTPRSTLRTASATPRASGSRRSPRRSRARSTPPWPRRRDARATTAPAPRHARERPRHAPRAQPPAGLSAPMARGAASRSFTVVVTLGGGELRALLDSVERRPARGAGRRRRLGSSDAGPAGARLARRRRRPSSTWRPRRLRGGATMRASSTPARVGRLCRRDSWSSRTGRAPGEVIADHPAVALVSGDTREGDLPRPDYVPASSLRADREHLIRGRRIHPGIVAFGVCFAVRRSVADRVGDGDERRARRPGHPGAPWTGPQRPAAAVGRRRVRLPRPRPDPWRETEARRAVGGTVGVVVLSPRRTETRAPAWAIRSRRLPVREAWSSACAPPAPAWRPGSGLRPGCCTRRARDAPGVRRRRSSCRPAPPGGRRRRSAGPSTGGSTTPPARDVRERAAQAADGRSAERERRQMRALRAARRVR